MKKILILFLCLFLNINVNAEEIQVKLSKCVDGDTARFIYKDEEIVARFLAIDTPETVHPTIEEEPYGKEASDYTCEALKNANKIILEFDPNSDKKDKYDRYLVWVFVDENLLQKGLIKKGYAEVAYLYDDYKYTNILEQEQEQAINNKVGIWSNQNNDKDEDKINELPMTNIYHIKVNPIIVTMGVIVVILIFIFSSKGRKEIIKRAKQTIKKELRK